MTTIKLFVALKIPDTTAITAFHTLERLGYKELRHLDREEYYEFVADTDIEIFMEEIVKVDILVNANKHSATIIKAEDERHDEGVIKVLVKNSGDNASGLLSILKNRMGFSNIKDMKKGILWKMKIESPNPKTIAQKITTDLLCNEHYQEFEII